jgi:hypothetical protein
LDRHGVAEIFEVLEGPHDFLVFRDLDELRIVRPAWQFPKRVLPFGNRSTRVTHASVMPGRSFCSTFQTISFFGVISSTQCPLPPPMSVL